MKIHGLRSSYEKVGGIVFFGRMLDKIRLHAQGKLPADYNLGNGLDGRCTRFLKVEYPGLPSGRCKAEPTKRFWNGVCKKACAQVTRKFWSGMRL